MKVAVVGAGGLGGYFGARLALGGTDVRFVARGAHLAAMRAHGLRVESVLGDVILGPEEASVTDDVASIGASDVVLVTVKSYDTETVARSIGSLIGPGTAVLSLQNGIDNEAKLAARVGLAHVVGGVAYIFTRIVEPGMVRHTGGPARIVFGELDGARSPRLEAFLSACQRAGIAAELSDAIRVELWTKYIFICAQAGLTAATRMPIGAVRDAPEAWALFRQVLDEGAAIGRSEGVPLSADVVDRHVAFASGLDPGLHSSLYDDLIAGRPMELEALLGELVRLAAKAGTAAPATAAIYALLLPEALRPERARPRA